MAFDTSPAAAPSRPRRIAGALLCALLFGVAPAVRAAEQVYIWRDASGTVRFSAVENGEPCAEGDAGRDVPRANDAPDQH